MSVRNDFFNTSDPVKILELYKQLTPDERDKQAIRHFNNVIKQIKTGDNHNPFALKRIKRKKDIEE